MFTKAFREGLCVPLLQRGCQHIPRHEIANMRLFELLEPHFAVTVMERGLYERAFGLYSKSVVLPMYKYS